MKTRILLGAISAALLAAGSASAAPITWTTSTFDNDSVLDLAGPPSSEVYGVDFGQNNQVVGTVTTANGYTFSPNYTSLGEGPLDVTSTPGNYVFTFTQFGFGISPISDGLFLAEGVPASSTDSVFNTILSNGTFEGGGGGGPSTAGDALGEGELTGLTPGQTYTIEILNTDNYYPPSSDIPRTITASDGVNSITSTQYAEDVSDPPFMGEYILGTFTADGTTQVVDTFVTSPALFPTGGFIDQAILLTTGNQVVPEPSAGSMILLGLVSLLGLRQLRRKSARLINS